MEEAGSGHEDSSHNILTLDALQVLSRSQVTPGLSMSMRIRPICLHTYILVQQFSLFIHAVSNLLHDAALCSHLRSEVTPARINRTCSYRTGTKWWLLSRDGSLPLRQQCGTCGMRVHCLLRHGKKHSHQCQCLVGRLRLDSR
jgi:hypothetical protein